MVYAADKYLRKFLGIASVRDPVIGADPNYEDPTFPIFSIKFEFTSRDSKHPDYLPNRLLTSGPESAVQFLYSVGEPERAKMLEKFISSLRKISEETPWYFQSVTGLDSLYSQGYINTRGTQTGLSDASITISTLESLDYRLHALKDLYRKAAYDRKYRRWILPINMRRFRMSVFIGDYRQMAITEDNYSINPRQALDALRDIDVFNGSNIGGKLLGKINDGALSFVKRLQWWDNHFSCMLFDCQDCEFDMSGFVTDLSHSRLNNDLDSKFTINIGRVLETNTYSLLKYAISDNLLENRLKAENENEVAKQSENLKNVFKPIVSSWKEYQNLEREKGDNKRVILEDNGFSNALGAGVSEALGGIGALGGSNLGERGGFLGSVGDFFGDTASELAQEALGMATEQIASNVYGNELTRSAAGVGLGILNGDLNQVARNFSNPALAGALGINVESSGRPVQPNLRDGVPSNVDLTAPSVQRSLSDAQANLVGEGADPRFQSIGRPGQSLFTNPNSIDRTFDQSNIDLTSPRVETEMPINVEFTEVRKETRLNPSKESLSGATPKTTLDEKNANLLGAGKKTDLTPKNADLTGAQPLKDLVPSNADLNGAEPLKDLVPSNADLNGAEPLKDLVPSNADLTGAQPLKDLVPSNADLNGAEPLKDLVPSNADLNGAEALKDLVPSNADLTGAQPLKDIVPSNADLNGAEALKDLVPSNADLTGAQPIRDLTPNSADLTGAQPIRDLTPNSADLTGAQPIRDLTPNSADLTGAQPISDLTHNSADLNGAEPLKDLVPSNADLTGAQPIRDLTPNSADLTGAQPIRDLTPNSADLTGAQPIRDLTPNSADLTGAQPIRDLTSKNIDFNEINVTRNLNDTQISLTEPNVVRDLNTTNLDLNQPNVKNSFDSSNVNLIGSEPSNTFSSENINFNEGSKVMAMDKSIELNGSTPLKQSSESNVNLIGYSPVQKTSLGSENLTGVKPITEIPNKNVGGMISDGVTDVKLGTENLVGQSPMTNFNELNIKLEGQIRKPETIENVELEGNTKDISIPKNIDLQGRNPQITMEKNIQFRDDSSPQNQLGKLDFSEIPVDKTFSKTNVELEYRTPTSTTLSNIGLTDNTPPGVIRSIDGTINFNNDNSE